jgi:hypothetical protein
MKIPFVGKSLWFMQNDNGVKQQKQFSPTFRNIVFCEAKASKGKKNDILEN